MPSIASLMARIALMKRYRPMTSRGFLIARPVQRIIPLWSSPWVPLHRWLTFTLMLTPSTSSITSAHVIRSMSALCLAGAHRP